MFETKRQVILATGMVTRSLSTYLEELEMSSSFHTIGKTVIFQTVTSFAPQRFSEKKFPVH